MMQRARDRQAVTRAIQALAPEAAPPDFREVVRALDGSGALRFRSVEDLLFVLGNGLRRRAHEARDDVELVRGTERSGAPRDWPHESSLQAYVHLRMREILAHSFVHEAVVILPFV